MLRKVKKHNKIRRTMANRFDAAGFDMDRNIIQKDRCIDQINKFGRKFPQTIAIRELKFMWSLMFPAPLNRLP